MLNQDDDFDNDEDLNEPNRISRKKILVFLIPALIAIGLGVGFFYAFNTSSETTEMPITALFATLLKKTEKKPKA